MSVRRFTVAGANFERSPGQAADIFAADLINARDGAEITIGYGRYAPDQTLRDEIAVDDVMIVLEGRLSVDTADVTVSAGPGEIIYMSKGDKVTIRSHELPRFILNEEEMIMSKIVSAAALAGALLSVPAQAQEPPKPTIVLVHGAFADSSGWNDVTKRLLEDGASVAAVDPDPNTPTCGEPTMSEKRTALVTGANKGIGLQIVRDLAAKGFIVYLGSPAPWACSDQRGWRSRMWRGDPDLPMAATSLIV